MKNREVTYTDFKKPMTGQGDDYTAGGLLDYPYFNEIVIIMIDLRK